VVLKGTVLVSVDNGNTSQEIVLSELAKGLLVPPMNWATQRYMSEGTMLMVACDQLFDEEDYIRDYDEFLRIFHSMKDGNSSSAQ
jgi:hypothetical protein